MLNKLDLMAQRARPWIPFTALNTVWRMLDKRSQTILDIGCGKGQPMRFINRRKQFYAVGADIFAPYLRECKRQGIHDEYILCDIRHLPFKNKSFDIVLCMEVLEHLDKGDGERLTETMEEIARKQVILSTPVGKYRQEVYNNNPHQRHRYIWTPVQMKDKGYRVKTLGLRKLGAEGGWGSRLPKVLQLVGNVLWFV